MVMGFQNVGAPVIGIVLSSTAYGTSSYCTILEL